MVYVLFISFFFFFNSWLFVCLSGVCLIVSNQFIVKCYFISTERENTKLKLTKLNFCYILFMYVERMLWRRMGKRKEMDVPPVSASIQSSGKIMIRYQIQLSWPFHTVSLTFRELIKLTTYSHQDVFYMKLNYWAIHVLRFFLCRKIYIAWIEHQADWVHWFVRQRRS